MTVSKYGIIDGSNNVVNICLWDGVTTWAPTSGYTAVACTSITGDVGIGWAYNPTTSAFASPTSPS